MKEERLRETCLYFIYGINHKNSEESKIRWGGLVGLLSKHFLK